MAREHAIYVGDVLLHSEHVTAHGDKFRLDLADALFEAVSAFATCGLSTGVTPGLPTAGKYIIAVLMFAGRTGTMTLAAALALRTRRRVIHYPEEWPTIG